MLNLTSQEKIWSLSATLHCNGSTLVFFKLDWSLEPGSESCESSEGSEGSEGLQGSGGIGLEKGDGF